VTKWSKDTWSSLCEGPCGMGSHLIAYNRKIQSGKTPFGVVNFKSTFASLDHSILGIGSISCNAHTHQEGWRLANLHLHHLMRVYKKVENGIHEMPWNCKYWEWESNKTTKTWEINMVSPHAHPFFPCLV
jgi:hypothetical protein